MRKTHRHKKNTDTANELAMNPAGQAFTPEYTDTKGASQITGLSESWLEKVRVQRSDGPPFIRVTNKRILYRVADLHAWMLARQCKSTSDRAA